MSTGRIGGALVVGRTSHTGSTVLIISALWLLLTVTSGQIIIIAPILPVIAEDLQVGEAKLGLLGMAYAASLMLMALVTGPISDRVGRRVILLTGTGGMAVVLLLHWIAGSYALLLVARLLAGIAGGVLSGSVVSYVGDYFSYERRGVATGWVMSGVAAGQIVALPLGVWVAFQMDFRMPFVLFGLVMALAFVMILLFVPQPAVRLSTQRLAIRPAVMNYVNLIRGKATGGSVWAYFLMLGSGGLFLFFMPVWLEEVHGLTGGQIAGLFVAVGVVNMVGSPAGGRLSDRVGRKPVIVLMCVLLAAALMATTWAIEGLTTAYIFIGVIVLLAAIRMSPMYTLMTALVAEDRRGSLMSLSISVGQFGFGVGAAIAGFLYAEFGYVSNTIASAMLALLMAVVIWRLLPEPPLSGGQPEERADALVSTQP